MLLREKTEKALICFLMKNNIEMHGFLYRRNPVVNADSYNLILSIYNIWEEQ